MDLESNSTAPSARPPRHHIWLVAIGLTAATLAIYGQAPQFDFVSWDDPGYIYENPHIAQGITMESVKWAFSSGYASNWHPITWISHMVDIEMFGLERGPGESVLRGPGGHHLVSVLLHVANSLLLLWLLTRMTGAFWPSALTAALFALHPLRVESVVWASERKDVLSGLFFMLTLLAYHGYTQRPTLRRYLLVFTSLALGLMSKPMLVTVPFVLLLLDLWPLRRMQFEQPSTLRYAAPGKETKVSKVHSSAVSAGSAEKPKNQSLCFVNFVAFCSKIVTAKRTEPTVSESNPAPGLRFLILEKLPLLALVLASGLVTMFVQKAGGAVSSLDRLPWAWRLVNAPVAYAMYLLKTLWPSHLAYNYPHPGALQTERFSEWVVWAGIAILCLGLVSVIAVCVARSRPYLLIGWLWFLGMLVPVIGLMQVGNQAWADRYAYLPLVGVYVMISWSLARCVQLRPMLRRAVIAIVLVALLTLLPCSWRQASVWRDGQTLYEHALAVTRNNFMAHYNLANDLQKSGRIDEAVIHHQQALSINPNLVNVHNNLGNIFARSGRPEEAFEHYREALLSDPNYVEAHGNWGNALQTMGRHEEAIGHYEKALEIEPTYFEAQYNWAKALRRLGKPDEAILHFKQALLINPKLAEAHNALGLIAESQGRVPEAIGYFEQALQLKPDYASARENLREVRAVFEE